MWGVGDNISVGGREVRQLEQPFRLKSDLEDGKQTTKQKNKIWLHKLENCVCLFVQDQGSEPEGSWSHRQCGWATQSV